jgi:hypothetical protein
MNPINIDRITTMYPFPDLNTISSPLNLTEALSVWFTTEAKFLAALSPKSGASWTQLFMDMNNLSSWSLGYDGFAPPPPGVNKLSERYREYRRST